MIHAADDQIALVRSFNRFYTRQLGLLEEGLLDSGYSLTEARVLYELAHRNGPTAADIARDLGLDAGYLSRILKKFEAAGLLTRLPCAADGRQATLALTSAGQAAFRPLDQASHDQVAALLERLSTRDGEILAQAFRSIQRVLGATPDGRIPYLLRPHQTGDIGWITHRQGLIYAQDYGWDESYEALVAEILSGFVKNFDPVRERAWIAERDREIVGSVFLVRQSEEIAKLRLLYVEPSARGLGIGARLVEECIRFARAKGYRTLTLWTNDILVSARRLYQAAGFTLTQEERHRSFGRDLVGQHWDLDLRAVP
jgi:DNA-binding MarR family transcriptional regulator/predicted GNAT family acetyltransferase